MTRSHPNGSIMDRYSHHSDSELMALLNTGNQEVFEFIYRKFAGDLYEYARRNISCKEDCQEIVQEIFESIWARHQTIQITTIRHYLIRMVRYKIIRYFRHSKVKRKFVEHYHLFEAIYEMRGFDPENPSLIQQELDRSIAQLPDKWQTALRLRLDEDLSNSDIAVRMNVSKRTVEWYMFEAFARIRSSFKPQEG